LPQWIERFVTRPVLLTTIRSPGRIEEHAMIANIRPLTYDDLLELPDDGKRREVLEGELIVNPAPRRDHQMISANLDWILQRYLRSSGAGRVFTHPVDLNLGRHNIVQPDLVVIREQRLDIYRPEGIIDEAPDIVVEILSPSSRVIDLVRKMALYARSYVPEYWVADPERRILLINRLQGDDFVPIEPDADGWIASPTLPGLRVDPAEVFSGLD
jgi:Uma2 family endonuclease